MKSGESVAVYMVRWKYVIEASMLLVVFQCATVHAQIGATLRSSAAEEVDESSSASAFSRARPSDECTRCSALGDPILFDSSIFSDCDAVFLESLFEPNFKYGSSCRVARRKVLQLPLIAARRLTSHPHVVETCFRS